MNQNALSFLVPVHNYNVTELVGELYRQASALPIRFEIIVIEDGSERFLRENERVGELEFCRYIPLKWNTGRSAVRNRLAKEAQYDQLVFIDCDAEVVSADYVRNYSRFRGDRNVVVGGTVYDPSENNRLYSLRLTYGRKREAIPVKERIKRRKQTFSTFNLLVSKAIYEKIHLDQNIIGYGHEDTLWAHCMIEAGYPIQHIDNPLLHRGLDENRVFIAKSESAVKNLHRLYRSGRYPFLSNESKLLRIFIVLKKCYLTALFAQAFKVAGGLIRMQLSSRKPSLRLFDFYKLAYLCRIDRRKI